MGYAELELLEVDVGVSGDSSSRYEKGKEERHTPFSDTIAHVLVLPNLGNDSLSK